ncbi:MAG: BrnT family toxin [Acidobacteria bacterium]|nr:BrnT family toxin [Acidobacteriota bacterium]
MGETRAVHCEWDATKARLNETKHGVSFNEAATVFLDPLALTYADPDSSESANREITIGYRIKKHCVFVCHCERGSRLRIISARRVTRAERKHYEEGIES